MRATRNRAPDAWQPGLRLPALEKLKIEASLIVPAALGARGRAIEVWDEGTTAASVRSLVARGLDFDRVVAD